MATSGNSSMIPPATAGSIAGTGGAGASNPAALTMDSAAKILTAAGGRVVTVEMVQAAIDAGAPVGPGGTINLVELMAWLEREMAGKP